MREPTDQPDRIEGDWRELLRCDDRDRAIGVTTTIAAMGFDVECEGSGGSGRATAVCSGGCAGGGMDLGDPPYIVRVPAAHLTELGRVLEEIVAEQAEFDQRLAQRNSQSRQLRRRVVVMALIAAMLILALLGLLRM